MGVGKLERKLTNELKCISNEHHSHTEMKREKENQNQSYELTSTVLGSSGAGGWKRFANTPSSFEWMLLWCYEQHN